MFSFSQQAQYKYEFKLTEVKSIQQAKVASEQMKDMFDVMPRFNVSTKYFEFVSPVKIPEDKFAKKIKGFGYSITDFKTPPEPTKIE